MLSLKHKPQKIDISRLPDNAAEVAQELIAAQDILGFAPGRIIPVGSAAMVASGIELYDSTRPHDFDFLTPQEWLDYMYQHGTTPGGVAVEPRVLSSRYGEFTILQTRGNILGDRRIEFFDGRRSGESPGRYDSRFSSIPVNYLGESGYPIISVRGIKAEIKRKLQTGRDMSASQSDYTALRRFELTAKYKIH